MTKKNLILIALAALLIGGVYGWSEFNRAKATANELPVKETIGAAALLEAFTTDEAAATARFVGTSEQVVQVTGAIRRMEPVGTERTNVVLETGNDLAAVVCEFANADLDPEWRSGANVTVNGFCTGLLLDVVLVRCTSAK